jgi:hypothetical protein
MAMADAESTAPVNEPSGLFVTVQELSVTAMMSAMRVFMVSLGLRLSRGSREQPG